MTSRIPRWRPWARLLAAILCMVLLPWAPPEHPSPQAGPLPAYLEPGHTPVLFLPDRHEQHPAFKRPQGPSLLLASSNDEEVASAVGWYTALVIPCAHGRHYPIAQAARGPPSF